MESILPEFASKAENSRHHDLPQMHFCLTAPLSPPMLRDRLAAAGWQLLTVVSVFDDAGLPSRQGAAGAFFLRF